MANIQVIRVTWRNQREAAKQKRLPKWYRQMIKRSKRFSLPWLTSHKTRRQRKQAKKAG